MQMKGATGELFKYNSTWHAFKVIVKSEGVYGLFKGMWPNLLKVKILYNAFFYSPTATWISLSSLIRRWAVYSETFTEPKEHPLDIDLLLAFYCPRLLQGDYGQPHRKVTGARGISRLSFCQQSWKLKNSGGFCLLVGLLVLNHMYLLCPWKNLFLYCHSIARGICT